MKYDIQERVFLVKKYYELKEIILIQRAYRAQYPKRNAPLNKEIKYIVSVFEKTGSVGRQSRKRAEPTEKRQQAIIQLKPIVENYPTISIRKAASAVGVSPTLVYHVFHDDLHLKPYKFHQWHKLEDKDPPKRLKFAEWFSELPAATSQFLSCSDEAYFYLTLPLNKQNNRVWSESDPCLGVEQPLQDEKVLVWCAISAQWIIGPYFFDESVNQHNYKAMLETFFWRKLVRKPDYKQYYFQQDGATPHTANSVQKWLTDQFGPKFIHKNLWPPRSPDLNPCDFFLWGHLKSRVYDPLPTTLDQLKANITREIESISIFF